METDPEISRFEKRRRTESCLSCATTSLRDTLTDDRFDGDVRSVDLPGEFLHRLVRVLVSVRVDVRSGRGRADLREQRCGHCKNT